MATSSLKWEFPNNSPQSSFRVSEANSVFTVSNMYCEKIFVSLENLKVFEFNNSTQNWLERGSLASGIGYRPIRFPSSTENLIFPTEIVDIKSEYQFIIEYWTGHKNETVRETIMLFDQISNFLPRVASNDFYSIFSNTRQSFEVLFLILLCLPFLIIEPTIRPYDTVLAKLVKAPDFLL